MRTIAALLIAAALALAPLPAVADEPAAEPPAALTWQEIAGWVGVGLGGAAVLTGVVFGGLGAKADGDYEQGVELMRTYEELAPLRDRGDDYNTVMAAGLVGGLVLAAIGTHLLVWGKAERQARQAAALAPMVSRGGAGLTARIRF